MIWLGRDAEMHQLQSYLQIGHGYYSYCSLKVEMEECSVERYIIQAGLKSTRRFVSGTLTLTETSVTNNCAASSTIDSTYSSRIRHLEYKTTCKFMNQ
jgi:hypothetical protein